MPVTLTDVARLAKVSVSTASLALNNKSRVGKDTRERVLEAARKLNYYPNAMARGLITQKSGTIGLVVTDVANPYFGSMTHFIEQAVRERGYNLILGVSNDDMELEKRIVRQFIGQRVDGILLVPVHKENVDIGHVFELQRLGVPFVFTSCYYPGVNASWVMCDLEKGSYMLTRYLLDTGHRRIMFLSGALGAVSFDLRRRGFRTALREAGLSLDERLIGICRSPSFDGGYERTKQQLNDGLHPDAITAINDVMALGSLKAVLEKGFKVPSDISIAGYDDVIFSSISEVPLTTVRQPIREIGEKSVEILTDMIAGRQGEVMHVSLEPELVIRQSTRCVQR